MVCTRTSLYSVLIMAVVIKSKIGHQKQLFRILELNKMQKSEKVGFVGLDVDAGFQ